MTSRAEVLVFCCHEDDLGVLRDAAGPGGPVLQTVASAVEVAHHAVARRPRAVFLGVGKTTLSHLDVIPVIRAVRKDLPVIVIAEEDSLQLEREARQQNIFYYLVHPIDRSEVEAVLKDALRHAGG